MTAAPTAGTPCTHPYFQVDNYFVDMLLPRLSGSAVKTWMALKRAKSLRDWQADQDDLIAMSGLTRNSVRAALSELADAGLIESTVPDTAGRGQRTVHTPCALPAYDNHVIVARMRAGRRKKGSKIDPFTCSKPDSESERGQILTPSFDKRGENLTPLSAEKGEKLTPSPYTRMEETNTEKNNKEEKEPPAAVVVDNSVFDVEDTSTPTVPSVPSTPLPEKTDRERTDLLRLLRDKGVQGGGAAELLRTHSSAHIRAALSCAPLPPPSYHNPGSMVYTHIANFDFVGWQARQSVKVQAQAVRQTQSEAEEAAQQARREAVQARLDALPDDERDAALRDAWAQSCGVAWPGEEQARQTKLRWPTALAKLPEVLDAYDTLPALPLPSPTVIPSPLLPASTPTGKQSATFAEEARQAKMDADLALAQQRLAAQQQREIDKQAARKAAESAEDDRVRAAAAAERAQEEARRVRRQGEKGGSLNFEAMSRLVGLPKTRAMPPQAVGDSEQGAGASDPPRFADAPENEPGVHPQESTQQQLRRAA